MSSLSKNKRRAPAEGTPPYSAAEQNFRKKTKLKTSQQNRNRKQRQGSPMTLHCVECRNTVADGRKGLALVFFEDGNALHLVLRLSDLGKEGTCFICKDVPPEKLPSDKNPYASVSHILCDNDRPGGKKCGKKVGAVKCMPPHSDNMLIFFGYKAVLLDGEKIKSWKHARQTSLANIKVMPKNNEDKGRQFKSRSWPPLIRCISEKETTLDVFQAPSSTVSGRKAMKEEGDTREDTAGKEGTKEKPKKMTPRPYQVELFDMVMKNERNALVYLPTGLGKTLVATMVLKKMLDCNPERQAVFLVETNALAIQQTEALREQTQVSVGMMVGSSFIVATDKKVGDSSARKKLDDLCARRKLDDLRAAKIVVATAGAFEHAMYKKYIDPESICCVVLDEAHHCGKEHPFHRVAKEFLVPPKLPTAALAGAGGSSASLATSASPRQSSPAAFPKLVALTASPAGELTVEATEIKMQELLSRLDADLAAPVKTEDEVRSRSPKVQLELVRVPATAAEQTLLRKLEKLILGRMLKLVNPSSDVGHQLESLLARNKQQTEATNAAAATDKAGTKKPTGEPSRPSLMASVAAPAADENWRFPNKTHRSLMQQVLSQYIGRNSKKVGGNGFSGFAAHSTQAAAGRSVEGPDRCAGEAAAGRAIGSTADPDDAHSPGRPVDDGSEGGYIRKIENKLSKLLNLCFAIDEIGGVSTWEMMMVELEEEKGFWSSKLGQDGAAAAIADVSVSGESECDPDKEDTLRLIKQYVKKDSSSSDDDSAMDDEEVEDGVGQQTTEGAVSSLQPAPTPAAAATGDPAAADGAEGSKIRMIASLLRQYKEACDKNKTAFSVLVFVSTRMLSGITPGLLEAYMQKAMPDISAFVKPGFITGQTEMSRKKQGESLRNFRNGAFNVLFSTDICAEGIDIPTCGLVVCTSLPNSGTALIQLRGRIRCEENCRLLGLSRTCGVADQEHVKTICRRESNMLEAIRKLSGGGGGGVGGGGVGGGGGANASSAPVSDRASGIPAYLRGAVEAKEAAKPAKRAPKSAAVETAKTRTSAAASSTTGAPAAPATRRARKETGVSPKPVEIPATAGHSSDCEMTPAAAGDGGTSEAVTEAMKTLYNATLKANAKMNAGAGEGKVSPTKKTDGSAKGSAELEGQGWSKPLPSLLSEEGRLHAMRYLASTTRTTVKKHGPDANARTCLNCSIQLAQALKPILDYDECKKLNDDQLPVFVARCFLISGMPELDGLIMYEEATGNSIKAAREAAASKVVATLLSLPTGIVQHGGVRTP